jgi:hypothetical protein
MRKKNASNRAITVIITATVVISISGEKSGAAEQEPTARKKKITNVTGRVLSKRIMNPILLFCIPARRRNRKTI